MRHTTLKFALLMLAWTALPAPDVQATNKFYFYARTSQYNETDDDEDKSVKAGGIYLYMSADMGEWTKERTLDAGEFAWGWYIDSFFGGGTVDDGGMMDFTVQPFGLRTRCNLGGDNLLCASYSPIELSIFYRREPASGANSPCPWSARISRFTSRATPTVCSSARSSRTRP